MLTPVIAIAGPGDGPAVAALRRAWTEENTLAVTDPGFEARFADWYERESARRITWLARVGGDPAGMMNLVLFERMPAPGGDVGSWGYLANAFVLGRYRNAGIGGALLTALLADADERRLVRVVLRPSDRSVPFYGRAGFVTDDGFLVRRGQQ